MLGKSIDDLDTPAVLVDLDRLEANLVGMADRARAAGVRLRPHTKTHKSAWIAAEQLRHGAAGLTVAKLGEAEVMADAGCDDVLIAYPIVGDAKLERLGALATRVRVAVSIDDIAVAEGLSRIGRRLRRPLDVFVEVDSGQHRCGRAPGTDSADLAERIAAADGLRLAGLMTHAGHSYGAESVDDRRRIALDEAGALVETARILEQRGVVGLELSIGSTPSVVHLAEVTAACPAITEARPGNYVFLDANQISMEVATEAECALTVLSTIVSRPAPDRAVADAGSKTLGGDGPAPRGRGFGRLLGEPRAAVDRVSEEHAWIRLDADVPWRIGDRVRIIPNHGCVVPNLAPTLLGVRGNVVERVIDVEARGMNR